MLGFLSYACDDVCLMTHAQYDALGRDVSAVVRRTKDVVNIVNAVRVRIIAFVVELLRKTNRHLLIVLCWIQQM